MDKIHYEEVLGKLQKGEDVSLCYQFISDETSQDIYGLLIHVMGSFDKLYLVEVVYTVMKEALMNATKANAKREYFLRKNMNINDPVHYKLGMMGFTRDIIMKWEDQSDFLNGSSLYVCLRIRSKNNELYFLVENNAPILPEEMERIQKRMDAAQKYNDLSEAFLDMGDTQESAGLGIVLSQLLLKNSGIGQERFKIQSTGKETRASLIVPEVTVPLEITNKIKVRIMNEMDGLPPLPQSLSKIIHLCGNPDTDLNIIAHEIEKNPAISADLLKLSNSAGFMVRQRVNTIVQAVKVVGLKNIRNLLYVTGVRKIMDGHFGKMQDIWDHSNRVSYYARILSSSPERLKYVDIAAVGGLLHDMGKLLILAIEKNLLNILLNYQKGRKMNNTSLLEEMSLGISHASLGALLARKWDFPEDLATIIENHHRPFLADENHREIVEMVYLANMIADVTESKRGFFAIDPVILERYTGVKTQEEFLDYRTKLEKGYQYSLKEDK